MKTFNILKKNRKYFAAEMSGYAIKILIDQNSESMELGEHTLEVDDISVRSKYGTDLIYKLSASVQEQNTIGICTLKTNFYNESMVAQCHALGGKWDDSEKAWIFSAIVADKVELLDEKYNSEIVGVEMTTLKNMYADKCGISIAGFPIAYASGRDSGAKLNNGIALVSGAIDSGGSVKNWTTKIFEGSIIRLEMPVLCVPDIDAEEFSVKILGE